MRYRIEKSYDTVTWSDVNTVTAEADGSFMADYRNGVAACFWRFTPIETEVAKAMAAESQAAQAASTAAQLSGNAGQLGFDQENAENTGEHVAAESQEPTP